MFAKKLYQFSSKSFSGITSSFINVFYTTSATYEISDLENNYDKSINYYQIQIENLEDYAKSYLKWMKNKSIAAISSSKDISEKPFLTKIKCGENLINRLFFWNRIKPNNLLTKAAVIQHASSSPLEMRIVLKQISDLDGYLLALISSHGFFQFSDFIQEKLSKKFQKYITKVSFLRDEKNVNLDELIKKSFKKTFNVIQRKFCLSLGKELNFSMLRNMNIEGKVLAIYIHDGKIYFGGKAEGKGILFQKKKGKYFARFLSNEIEPDPILPSIQKFSQKKEQNSSLNSINDIKICKIDFSDKYLMLLSFNILEILSLEDLETIVNIENSQESFIAERIFNVFIDKLCEKKKLEKEKIMELSLGTERKKIHQDICIAIVDLHNDEI